MLQNHSIPSLRPYQQEGVGLLVRDIINYAKTLSSATLGIEVSERVQQIHNLRSDVSSNRPSENVGLVDMTMGSGKTRVLGEFLRRVIRLRNKFTPGKSLNILVLSDRINLVDQLEGDLISGRDNTPGMLARVISDGERKPNIQRIHSQNTDKNTELEQGKDNIILSTIQSVENVKGTWDIIIVDEADSVLTNGNRDILIQMVEEQETPPYILGFTGTIDTNLVDLLGDPLFSYGLDEYLRSEYAPDIDYHLMTANTVSTEELRNIHAMIAYAKEETDLPKKKKFERDIRNAIEMVLARFDGYTSVVQHLMHKSGIDLSKRTLVFVPSIEDADEVAQLINDEGKKENIPYHAKSLHSETEESDLSVLQEFRADNHLSILVTVNKLNRGTDIPTIENIISLRDTQSKRVFLQQIGRGMRGDMTQIYDYTPSLTNLIWMRDVLSTKVSQKSGNKTKKTGRNRQPGFMVGTNTQEIDSNLIDFFTLVGKYVEHTRITQELLTTEDWIEALRKHGITNGDILLKKGVMWFWKTFGKSDLGKILGRTLRSVSVSDLRELAEKLEWEAEKELLTAEDWIEALRKHGITNGDILLKKGVMWFWKTFGMSGLGKILGRTLQRVTISELRELAEKLGWKTEKELLTTEDWIEALSNHGITNGDILLQKGVVWFQKTFGMSGLGKILGRTLRSVSMSDLRELAEKLGWEIKTESQLAKEWIEALKKYGVTNGDILIKKGSDWFKKTFGISGLGKILGRTLQRVTISELRELAEKLGWEIKTESQLAKEWIEALKKYGVTNGDILIKKGSDWFKKTFGKLDLGKILGRTLRSVSISDLRELAEKLGWKTEKELLTAEDWIEVLRKHGVTNGDELLEKGAIWFQKTFGRSGLAKILGRTLQRVTISELRELAEKLGWKTEKELLTAEDWIEVLRKHGVTNGDELLEKGAIWFQKTFGRSGLAKILGRTLRSVSISDLRELAEKLGWVIKTESQLTQYWIEALRKHGVTNGDTLLQKGVVWFQKTFGKSGLGKILGRTLRSVSISDLRELTEKLGWEIR